jgi:hypothetical protein
VSGAQWLPSGRQSRHAGGSRTRGRGGRGRGDPHGHYSPRGPRVQRA